MRINGLGAVQLYPPNPGISRDVAAQACATAGGTWQDAGWVSSAGCNLDAGVQPMYCAAIPDGLKNYFSDCSTPVSQAQIAAYSAYPIYVAAQNHPGTAATPVNTDVQNLIDQSQAGAKTISENVDCSTLAETNYPSTYLALGHPMTEMLTNPFSTGCKPSSGIPGWALYIALGVAGYLLLGTLLKK